MSESRPLARRAVRDLRASQIREVANAAMGDPNVLPFWFGEPDEVTPEFIRAAAIEALSAGDTHGEAVVERFVGRLRSARDLLVSRLRALPGVAVAPPPGAMYAFFHVAGIADSLAFCKHLVVQAKLGLAPGAAFGPEGEGFVRWCFAAREERLAEGVARLADTLERR